MAEYLDVLVLCSDPVNLRPTLNLAQELVHFEQIIRRSELPIRLRRVFPPTLEQLQLEFSRAEDLGRQPAVFHFLGHGDDDGLYFENEHGEAHLVKGHALQQALAQSPVKLVLLNACWSATKRGVSLCEFLTRERVASAAIGHERPIADASAIEFARRFYALVTQGQSVRAACQWAANALAEQGQSGAAEVKLVGDGEFALTAGVSSGSRPFVIESGMPKLGHLADGGVFFGRGEELVQLSRSLADASLAGFGLWGIGGIGKTALAKVAARRNAWRYQGIAWVDIREATQKTTAELLCLALCRLHPGAPDRDPAFELTRRLKDAPSLIVLDNLEDLPEPEHAALARFVQQIPRNGSRVLLTARVPLAAIERLPDVHSRRLTVGLDAWNGAHYVQHVARQKKCQALQEELRIEGSQPEGLCVLVTQQLHGHPKMLELAVGVALRGRSALEQALVELPEDLEEQLVALLATTLQCLGDDGRRVLPLFAFFPAGSLTPEALEVAARAVDGAAKTNTEDNDEAGDDSESDDDAEPELPWLARGRDQLVAAGLLDYDQTRDIYTFHQLILEEARRRRPSNEAFGAAIGALLFHFAEYLAANHDDNKRIDRCFGSALVLMESLWARRDGESPDDAIIAAMTDLIGSYFQDRGLWRLGHIWHERAIELRRASKYAQNDASLALQLYQQGQLLASRGKPDAARATLNEALKLLENTEMQRKLVATLHALARLESAQGNPSEARRLLERSLVIIKSLRNKEDMAAWLRESAMIEADQANPKKACRLLRRCIKILESKPDSRQLAVSLHELARIELQRGDLDESRRLLKRSLASFEALEDPQGQASSLHELARIESIQGNLSEARRLLGRSLPILESLDDQHGLSASLHELALIELAQNNPSEARRLLQRSITIDESLGDKRALSASLHALGDLEFGIGKRKKARQLWERSIQIKQLIGDTAGAAVTKGNLAQLEALEGRFARAIELASQAVQELERPGYAQAEQAREILRQIQQLASSRSRLVQPPIRNKKRRN